MAMTPQKPLKVRVKEVVTTIPTTIPQIQPQKIPPKSKSRFDPKALESVTL